MDEIDIEYQEQVATEYEEQSVPDEDNDNASE